MNDKTSIQVSKELKTSIQISKELKARLDKCGGKGDTYEQIINRLVSQWEKKNDSRIA